MRIAVIGPLEVLTDAGGRVPLPDARERLLLAVLAAAAPDVVRADRLAEALPPEDPGEPAGSRLPAALALLRHSLEPAQPPGASGQYVLRRGAGYVLATARGDVDALHFGDLVGRGRVQLEAGDEAEAVRSFTAALQLWRGQPYGEWPDAGFAVAERRRLTDLRSVAETGLREARRRLGERAFAHPAGPPVPGPPPLPAGREPPPAEDPAPARAAVPIPRTPWDPLPGSAPGGPAPTDLAPTDVPPTDVAPAELVGRRRSWLVVGWAVAALAVALAAAGLAIRSHEEADRTAAVAAAHRLVALSETASPLDSAFLLAAEAFRLADTSETRGRLRSVLEQHERIDRTVSFHGNPEDAVLSGGGRTLTIGVGISVVVWPVSDSDVPSLLMEIPASWGAWLTAAPSPVESAVMGAGMGRSGPWLRMVSALDGTSRLLLEGDQVGGRPVAGAIVPDGSRILLVVAEPAEVPGKTARWSLCEVDVADGTRRDTGIGGLVPVPVEGLHADFADDAGSFVVWTETGTAPATLVDVATARQTPIDEPPGPATGAGFRATGSGAVELWDDGRATRVDLSGSTVQDLGLHAAPVRDVAVSPDGSWAVTVDDAGRVIRWDVEPGTGRWARPEVLAGHTGGVVSVVVDAAGRTLVTVGRDRSIISWRMGAGDGGGADLHETDPAAWLGAVCAVVGRDLTQLEWRRFLPDVPWRPTCTDLR